MTKDVFARLLNEKQYKAIKSILDEMNPVDIAVLLPEFEDKQVVLLFRLIPKENASMVFSYMEPEQQQVLVEAFTDSELKFIMDDMFIDDTVDVIEEMPANVVERMLRVAGDKRTAINTILQYPEDSAGSIMTLEYISLHPAMTIGDALKKIKSRGEYSETVNVCYVIEKHRLLGTITAMDLLTCDDDEILSDVMEENPITVNFELVYSYSTIILDVNESTNINNDNLYIKDHKQYQFMFGSMMYAIMNRNTMELYL